MFPNRFKQAQFKQLFSAKHPEIARSVNPEEVESFVKNAHHIRVLRGKQWGAMDQDREAIGTGYSISSYSCNPDHQFSQFIDCPTTRNRNAPRPLRAFITFSP